MERHHAGKFWFISSLSIAAVLIVTGLLVNRHYVKLEVDAYAQKFALLSNLRRNALEDYFDTVSAELHFWAINPQLLSGQKAMTQRWHEYAATMGDPASILRGEYIGRNPYNAGERSKYLGRPEVGDYSKFHYEFHPFARRFVTERGYHDMFLISPQGDVFYTVEKEFDFGSNLIEGRYKHTGLAWAFKAAIKNAKHRSAVFSDMAAYEPSDYAPAMFIAKALIDSDGRLLGVMAFQLPVERIQSIMGFNAGMGASGETYLVGEDKLMRSDSRFSDNTSVLELAVESDTVNKALDGEQGVALVKDYRGIQVLSAYTSLDMGDIRWAVMAEIDETEILAELSQRRPLIGGTLLFLYTLAMWSLWFIRPGDWGAGMTSLGGTDGDFADIG